ncbi:MAG: L-2-hydroxyglutarate oxidase [Edaphobacter sp.]
MNDFAIIGGGIVGVATAMQLLRTRPGSSVVLLEKEASLGQHQTGHNSGVIHAGVYYAPGSLKAKFCKEGALATYEFCRENDIACERIGKLIVATSDLELGPLNALADRCGENGIAIERMSASEVKRLEPNIRTVGGFLVPLTGITDYRAIVEAMRRQILQMGGKVLLSSKVVDIRETSDAVEIIARNVEVSARTVIVCGGIMADRLADMCGLDADFRMVPFRGEYFQLPANKKELVRHLIYPVPDPKLPFLGVHLTPMVGGFITVGPNAVLGLSRVGYPKLSINLRDLWETVSFPGFWPMAKKHFRFGTEETWNAIYKRGYLNVCRRYCPDLNLDDLLPYPAGIRAQAVLRDGTLVHDFLIRRTPRTLHVCNAPSPAATSAIPIAKHIVELALGKAD